MNADLAAKTPAILILSHGSPRAEANAGFTALVSRVAARLGAVDVLPAFFSLAEPTLAQRVAELAARGARRILIMPYFLYSGQHVSRDIPGQVEECRRQFPGVTIEVLPTLENEPAVEDAVVERLAAVTGRESELPTLGADIQRRSREIIARQLGDCPDFCGTMPQKWDRVPPGCPWRNDSAERRILERIIHATADFSFARSLRIHPRAVAGGRAALAAGKPIICDVRMLQAGITQVRGGNEVLAAIDLPEVAALAHEQRCTRAAAAVEILRPRLEGAIFAVGNAPTALAKLLEIARGGGPRPALVVGLPVGLVGAREAKLALLQSDLCYITNTTPRGGSPAAAAAVNALAALDEESL